MALKIGGHSSDWIDSRASNRVLGIYTSNPPTVATEYTTVYSDEALTTLVTEIKTARGGYWPQDPADPTVQGPSYYVPDAAPIGSLWIGEKLNGAVPTYVTLLEDRTDVGLTQAQVDARADVRVSAAVSAGTVETPAGAQAKANAAEAAAKAAPSDAAVANLLGSATSTRAAVDGRVTAVGNGTYVAAVIMAGAGIDPTGVADSTAALQAKLDTADAARARVVWPAGTFLTGTLTYRCQPMQGAGRDATVIKGKPGQDVFRLDSTLTASARQHARIVGLTVKVDDSTNAAASFPQRGGVGNAGFATDYADGANPMPLRFHRAHFEDVLLTSVSGTAQNASCGLYAQAGINLTTVVNMTLSRLAYGWWEHHPTSNATSVELFSDHNHIVSLYTNGCLNSFRGVNWANGAADSIICHGTQTNGVQFAAVTSQNRSTNEDVHLGSVFVEDASGTPLALAGVDFDIDTVTVAGPHNAVEIGLSSSVVRNLSLSTGSDTNPPPLLRLTGNNNDVEVSLSSGASTTDYLLDLVDDQGKGNRVTVRRLTNTTRLRRPQLASRDSRVLHQRDAAAVLLGLVDDPFTSGADLLVNPTTIFPTGTESTDWTHDLDSTAPLGWRLRIPTAGGNFFTTDVGGQRSFVVGRFLPAGKIRVYVRAKVATGGTQTWSMTAGGTNVGSGTLTWTTSYTTRSFDIDLTGYTSASALQITVNALGGGGVGPLDVAFIAFRPFASDLLLSGGLPTLAAPMVTGLYYTSAHPSTSTGSLSLDYIYAVPVPVTRACTLDRIAAEVTTAGGAGALLRLGVYGDSGGQPGTLLVDAGTADATTTGSKVLTISTAVPAGVLWLALVMQGATCTIRTVTGSHPMIGTNSATPGSQGHASYRANTTTAAGLPATWAGTNLEQFNSPRLFVRAS